MLGKEGILLDYGLACQPTDAHAELCYFLPWVRSLEKKTVQGLGPWPVSFPCIVLG